MSPDLQKYVDLALAFRDGTQEGILLVDPDDFVTMRDGVIALGQRVEALERGLAVLERPSVTTDEDN